ncbi:MAG: hypothetical protein ACE1ZE_05420 [Candidatus Binatia bacterium]
MAGEITLPRSGAMLNAQAPYGGNELWSFHGISKIFLAETG